MRRGTIVTLVAGAVLATACGGGEGNSAPVVAAPPTPLPSPSPSPSAAPSPSPSASPAAPLGSLGAGGWASTAGGTSGGDGATAEKTYTVRNRNELIQALYGGTARINADGSFSGTADTAKKIIYVAGTISLNMNQALVEQTADDYVRGSCAQTTHGFAGETALWTAYYAAYRPSVWGTAGLPTGTPEAARVCAATQQRRLVVLSIPSNTSIIGVGATAKIIHGNLSLGSTGTAVDNVVIRNIAFEDAFDFFPQWDPTDSTTGRWNSAYDLISITNATHVWIDRSSFGDGARPDKLYPSVWTETVGTVNYAASDFKVQHHDGLIDPTRLANLVTISNSVFQDHDKSFLIGGTDTASTTAENPTVLKITFHDNWFRNLRQRQPRVRFGQVHVFNNYFEGSRDATADYPWLVGLTVGQSGKLHAENNVFAIPGAASSVLWSVSTSATRSAACVTLGYTEAQCGASFFESGTVLNGTTVDLRSAVATANPTVATTGTWRPADVYNYTLKPTATLAATVTANAGPGRP